MLLCSLAAAASPNAKTIIKLAIVDNFRYQKFVTTHYKEYYLSGLELAIVEAKKDDVHIIYKVFQYNDEPLSIINKIAELQRWKPDFIIGPRDSNRFLLLAPHISDTLTLSPFATSLEIKKLPGNFHTMPLLSEHEAEAMFVLMQKDFPTKNAFLLTEADCKSCVDVSESLLNIWKKNNIKKIDTDYYVSNSSSNITLEKIKLMDEAPVIILPNLAHNTAYLMSKISGLFSNKITTFIGGDGWGDWHDTEVGKLGKNNTYESYHVVPWSLDVDLPEVKEFSKAYQEYYQDAPKNKLSFVIYRTIISATTAYKKYQNQFNGDLRYKLMRSYNAALKCDPYWFKPIHYVVYKIKNQTNCVYALVNPINHSIERNGASIHSQLRCFNDG